MVKSDETPVLKKDEFFVAVRLIQFRQNQESVRNLTLTVPSHVDLKPPYFKGISDFKLEKSDSQDQFGDDWNRSRPAQISNTFFQEKCLEMHKEMIQLKQKLQATVDELNEVKKDNCMLRRSVSQIIIHGSSSKLLSQCSSSKMKKKHRKQGSLLSEDPNSTSHFTPRVLSVSNETKENVGMNDNHSPIYVEFETPLQKRNYYQRENSLISDLTEESGCERRTISLNDSEETLNLAKLKNLYRDQKRRFKR